MTSEQDVFIQNLRIPETMIQDIADEFDMTTEEGEERLTELREIFETCSI